MTPETRSPNRNSARFIGGWFDGFRQRRRCGTLIASLCGVFVGTLMMPALTMAQEEDAEERTAVQQYRDQLPWDFRPYDVLIWIAGVDGNTIDNGLGSSIRNYLDRDFAALWRTSIVPAPSGMGAIANRDFEGIDFSTLTADDPVVVIKRDHPDAARIRFQSDVATHIDSILVSSVHAQAVQQRGEAVDNADLHGMVDKFSSQDVDLLRLRQQWADEATEAMLLPRGLMLDLDPEPKVIELDVTDRMGDLFSQFDKIFLVHVAPSVTDYRVQVREIDCLMRHPGPILRETVGDADQLPRSISRLVRGAFAPMVRLDEVGTESIQGLIRGGGLITDPESPANIEPDTFLQPFLRRDDRTGEPSLLGVVEWTFLRVMEKRDSKLKIEMFSGLPGALAGRRNDRTHRIGLKVRPVFTGTTLRLHAKGDPEQPLAGYDIFERDLETDDWIEVGQTDWDGRLMIDKAEDPMRLLYVKNGLQVLARLPMVPGQTALETADLIGDDIRLQAEAYIRGVQNSIIDLVAIRKLLASSIRRHLEQGEVDRARDMLDRLRKEPTYEKLADDMAQKQTEITSRNRNEQAKIDSLFGETRDLLVKHINQSLINELDREVNAAMGKPVGDAALPTDVPASEEGDDS